MATQNADGGWGDAPDYRSSPNDTLIATSALQMVAPDRAAEHIKRGQRRLEEMGGLDCARQKLRGAGGFTYNRLTFGAIEHAVLAGQLAWKHVMRLPIEMVLIPLNIRVRLFRMSNSYFFPGFLAMGLTQVQMDPPKGLRGYIQHRTIGPIIDWFDHAFGTNDNLEESAPMTAAVALALKDLAKRDARARSIFERAMQYVERTQAPDGSWSMERDVEIYDTCSLLLTLQAAGVNLLGPTFARTRDWLLRSQHTKPWFFTGTPPGGWGWNVPGAFPDSDDTSLALSALSALGVWNGHPQMRAGLRCLLELQNSDGSWGIFIKDSRLAFDQACPYITSHALMALKQLGFRASDAPVRRAIQYLAQHQAPDGSFEAIWYRTTWSTGAVLYALSSFGLAQSTTGHKCQQWLLANQKPDGSWTGQWPEGPEADPDDKGTIEETAWALLGLLSAGLPLDTPAIEHGIRWLLEKQRIDGTWPESVVSRYFVYMAYSNSHYALAYALRALALYYHRATGARASGALKLLGTTC
jgi:squalene-hopene/tetraprenyl-beta-curcumene cyclase